jgi:hypothetical protein
MVCELRLTLQIVHKLSERRFFRPNFGQQSQESSPNRMDLREVIHFYNSNFVATAALPGFRILKLLAGIMFGHRSRSRYDNEPVRWNY